MQKSGDKKTNAMEKEIYLVQSALSAKQTVARVRCILREKSIPITFVAAGLIRIASAAH